MCGFFVTASASALNKMIEVDIDKLMVRTANRPLPAGRMSTGKALVISIMMGLLGISILCKLNFIVGKLSLFQLFCMLLYIHNCIRNLQ
ncbi:UbiA family prenyltransferase [Sphingobacterium sp. HMA12]|uniref:UbiA family prenyltransferase n=1 Tax=Sphingobacterium sp. HMA12 TaxID=2050894 RepID=UPI00352A5776